jgi:hypothetical protein
MVTDFREVVQLQPATAVDSSTQMMLSLLQVGLRNCAALPSLSTLRFSESSFQITYTDAIKSDILEAIQQSTLSCVLQ